MQVTFLAATATLAALAAALPSPATHVIHEKRSGSSSWTPKQGVRLDGNIKLPVRIGLTESNLHLGDGILMEVSDPASKRYGQHLDAQQV